MKKRGSPFSFGLKVAACHRASSTARFQNTGSLPDFTKSTRWHASEEFRWPLIAMMPSAHCERVDLSMRGL
jgi:hypothetical protein